LRHGSLKPSYACIEAIQKYFSSLHVPVKDEELIIVGDRIFTDVVMANRMSRRRSTPLLGEKGSLMPAREGPLAVWTTGVWQRQGMLMRWLEKTLVMSVERWSSMGEP
jgi:phosphatidylglycerophosphatase GEP4